MLLWINGPFGGGKTQTAHEIARRLPGSVICDPEHVGFGLHRTLPPPLRGDFQDLPAWRTGVFEVLDLALSAGDQAVIAPMTLIDPRYFDEIIGRLRRQTAQTGRGHSSPSSGPKDIKPVCSTSSNGRLPNGSIYGRRNSRILGQCSFVVRS